jgi:hypothetical protein
MRTVNYAREVWGEAIYAEFADGYGVANFGYQSSKWHNIEGPGHID